MNQKQAKRIRKTVFRLARNYPTAFAQSLYQKMKKLYNQTPRPLREDFISETNMVDLINSKNILKN